MNGDTLLSINPIGGILVAEKGRKEEKKAARSKERMRQVQTARENMAAVRQQRIAQAQVIQGAATGGISESSGAQGGYSAIGSSTSIRNLAIQAASGGG